MTWTNKYWDIIEQLYWTPKYIGLQSIPQSQWKKEDGFVCVPSDMTNKTGPLYSRKLNNEALMSSLRGNEEVLNHVFDLTFSITPDPVINEVILSPLGFSDSGPIMSLGRETSQRYNWGRSNVTQHDGLFVSNRSAVGVELKLDSPSWPEQIAKYAALLTWEEIHMGPRQQLGLLFIVPSSATNSHWQNCGLEEGNVDRNFMKSNWNKKLPRAITSLFESQAEHVCSVFDRMKLGIITWDDLRESMLSILGTLDLTHRGDLTLHRLISGFLHQVETHRGTGIQT